MTTINSFSLEDLQVKLNELHDCMYTLLYYEDDFTQEQIRHFIKIDPHVGLTDEDTILAMHMLNS